MTDTEHRRVECNIRSMTTAIQFIQPKNAASDTPVPAAMSQYKALSKAYNHLAVLLTQGSDIDGAGRRVVAVTGHSTRSGLSVSAIESVDQLPSIDSVLLTQNLYQMPDGQLLGVEEVERSGKSLSYLADVTANPPVEEVTLAKYASDLLEGLVQYSENPTGEGVSFLRFLWLRCHRKIRNRLQADQLMLGKRFPGLLADWNLEEDDEVDDHWFHVDLRTHPILDKHSIPYRLREDKASKDKRSREYLFSSKTVPFWRNFFVQVLTGVQESAETSDMSRESVDGVNRKLHFLHVILYRNRALETLLALPSLEGCVKDAMRQAELDGRSLGKWRDILDFEVGFDPDDPSGNPMLRYCKATVAWIRAAFSLSRSRIFQMETLPKFRVVHSYLRSDVGQMTDLRLLMMETILPRLTKQPEIDKRSIIEELLARPEFANKHTFTGTIHCEASLMALIHFFSVATPERAVAPFTKITQDLRDIFVNADRVIGVGKKSCLCCYWLAQLLGEHGEAFLVPGTHGIVFPWTPPVHGIPLETLQALEKRLILKLTDVTALWIASYSAPQITRQRSAALQSFDSSIDDGGFAAGWDED